jgi:hypothetical protein
MKSTMKPLRKGVYDCLNGNVTYPGAAVVPIYDEKVITGSVPNVYILLSTQRERDMTGQDCAYDFTSSIDILVIAKSGSEVSKDAVDDISDRCLELLLNLPGSHNLGNQNGFQILNLKLESAASGNVLISPTQSELQKVLTLSASIIHQ